jgi:hypothetical protein
MTCPECKTPEPLHTAECSKANKDNTVSPAVLRILKSCEDFTAEELGQLMGGLILMSLSKGLGGAMKDLGLG